MCTVPIGTRHEAVGGLCLLPTISWSQPTCSKLKYPNGASRIPRNTQLSASHHPISPNHHPDLVANLYLHPLHVSSIGSTRPSTRSPKAKVPTADDTPQHNHTAYASHPGRRSTQEPRDTFAASNSNEPSQQKNPSNIPPTNTFPSCGTLETRQAPSDNPVYTSYWWSFATIRTLHLPPPPYRSKRSGHIALLSRGAWIGTLFCRATSMAIRRTP